MSKDKIIAKFLLKLLIVLSGIALSILSVVLFDVHIGFAIAFIAIVLTVLALDNSKLVSWEWEGISVDDVGVIVQLTPSPTYTPSPKPLPLSAPNYYCHTNLSNLAFAIYSYYYYSDYRLRLNIVAKSIKST